MKYTKRATDVPKLGDVYRRTVYQNNKFPYVRVRVDCFDVKKQDEVVIEYHTDKICIYPMKNYDKSSTIVESFKSGMPVALIAEKFKLTQERVIKILHEELK